MFGHLSNITERNIAILSQRYEIGEKYLYILTHIYTHSIFH